MAGRGLLAKEGKANERFGTTPGVLNRSDLGISPTHSGRCRGKPRRWGTLGAMASSPPAPDLTKRLRARERATLVEYIVGAPMVQETDYLEWKSFYDLSTKPGAASTSRHLIGFGNREPSRAARVFDGYAYLLIGLEPGQLHGAVVWDSAKLDNWIEHFVGPELVYEPYYVSVQGQDILLLEVAPPKRGDPIHYLRRTTVDTSGKTLREGAIYVRKGGLTEQAKAGDMSMLNTRVRAEPTSGPPPLDISVEIDTSRLMSMGDEVLTNDFRDEYIAWHRTRLLRDLPRPATNPMLAGLTLPPVGEFRSEERFRKEVEDFLTRVEKDWMATTVCEHIKAASPALVFKIVNATDRVFEDVELEVTLPLERSLIHLDASDARATLKPPKQPARWGSGPAGLIQDVNFPSVISPDSPDIEARGEETTLVRFRGRLVRPRTNHELPELAVGLFPRLAGTKLTVNWRVTARNTRGDLSGTVTVQIPRPVEDESGENGQAEARGAHLS